MSPASLEPLKVATLKIKLPMWFAFPSRIHCTSTGQQYLDHNHNNL